MGSKRESRVASGESGSAEISPLELGKFAGYSKQQVVKWCAMGLPHRSSGKGKAKRLLIDRDAGLKWIKGNATGIAGAHGGKRKRAGRPARKQAPGSNPPASPPQPRGAASAQSEATPPGCAGTPPPTPRRLTPPRNLERESFGLKSHASDEHPQPPSPVKHWDEMSQREKLEYLSPMRADALTQVQVKQILDAQKVLTEELARMEKERTLISVEEAKKAWTEFLTAAARSLVHQRNALAQALISENGLPVTLLDRFKLRIEQENQKVITAMRAALIDEPDAEEA